MFIKVSKIVFCLYGGNCDKNMQLLEEKYYSCIDQRYYHVFLYLFIAHYNLTLIKPWRNDTKQE